MKRGLAVFAALVAGMAEFASAQLMGARELNVGVPIKAAPSAKPIADVYYLAGEAGAKETYTVVAKGEAGITLFGPDGSEILTSAGSGTVRLEVVLPFTDVFTVAIARKISAQPYTLSRKTTVPTFLEASMAIGAGYGSRDGTSFQCWIVPGVKLRTIDPEQTVEFTLAADRKTATYFAKTAKSQQTGSGEVTQSYDGTQVHYLQWTHDGRSGESRFPLKVAFDPQTNGRYTGYLCKN